MLDRTCDVAFKVDGRVLFDSVRDGQVGCCGNLSDISGVLHDELSYEIKHDQQLVNMVLTKRPKSVLSLVAIYLRSLRHLYR